MLTDAFAQPHVISQASFCPTLFNHLSKIVGSSVITWIWIRGNGFCRKIKFCFVNKIVRYIFKLCAGLLHSSSIRSLMPLSPNHAILAFTPQPKSEWGRSNKENTAMHHESRAIANRKRRATMYFSYDYGVDTIIYHHHSPSRRTKASASPSQ